MKIFLQRFKAFPHFLYLLPLFFVFHGYTQNLETVTISQLLLLTGEYLLAAAVLFLLGFLIYRNRKKATLFAFGLLFFHLFFGAMHDLLKGISPNFFVAKYSILLPVCALLLLLFIIWLKKSKRNFTVFFTYLNLLFLVLLLMDVPKIFTATQKQQATLPINPCADCNKPDVYLIIADEYADSTSLKQLTGFNNNAFLTALRSRGFQILNSVSNYNYTPFSMAAMLSMGYISGLEGRNQSYPDRVKCATLINQNPVLNFFKGQGYAIRNNSIFQFNNIPTVAPQTHFKIGIDFIASHTFWQRVRRDLGYHLITTFKIVSGANSIYSLDRDNKLLARRLQDNLKEKVHPKFVYTHIHIPHYPYYYKSDGSANLQVKDPDHPFDKTAYTEYLQYGNRIYFQLIDQILRSSSQPPVIIFMGDHGFRQFSNQSPDVLLYKYRNMNAVLLPNGNYQPFYEGISGVNQFRALLNAAFGQKLPMLKDSTSFLEE